MKLSTSSVFLKGYGWEQGDWLGAILFTQVVMTRCRDTWHFIGGKQVWIKHNRILRSKVWLLLVILLVGGVIASGCANTGAVPRGWSGGTMVNGTLFLGSMNGELIAVDTANGNRLWAPVVLETTAKAGGFGCAPSATSVAIYGSPAVAGDLIYIGGYDGKIHAISVSTRLSKARYLNEDDQQPTVGGPVVAWDKVYIGSSDGKLYALDATSLDEEWQFQTGDKIWSTPVIDGETVYITSFDKKLYALNAADGSERWQFETEGAIVATPLIYNNTVYFGSFDRYFYAIDAADGRLKWKFAAENWFWAKAVVYDNTVYAASLDGKVYALDAKSGYKRAEIDLENPISSSPVVVGDLIIVATEEGEIYSIYTSNNQKRELIDLEARVDASLSASPGVVYVHTQEREALQALDVQTGVVLWTLPLTSK